MTVAAILLAAERADIDAAPLALAPWGNDQTLIEYEIAALLGAGADAVEVVLGYDAERIIPFVAQDNVEPIVDATWQLDMASAIRIGAAAVPRGTREALIIDVTRPRTPHAIVSVREAHAHGGAAVTRAASGATPGWPAVVTADVLAELRNATAETDGIEGVLARHRERTRLVELPAIDALARIESRAGYEELRSHCARG